jgi:hypothetical protein
MEPSGWGCLSENSTSTISGSSNIALDINQHWLIRDIAGEITILSLRCCQVRYCFLWMEQTQPRQQTHLDWPLTQVLAGKSRLCPPSLCSELTATQTPASIKRRRISTAERAVISGEFNHRDSRRHDLLPEWAQAAIYRCCLTL